MAEIWDLWEARRGALQAASPLAAVAAGLPAPAEIPPREWLYGTSLIRRFVSILVAPGGVGKSSLALAQALALATGADFLGERVHHSVRVWVLNLEDPREELHRRVAALMLRHRIEPAAVAGRFFLHSGRERRVTVAALGPDGAVIHPDRDAIIAAAREAEIGCITVDPFVKSHALEENSNPHMDAAATAWAEIAEATGAAVQLVHHVRKGTPGVAPDVDAARGGKALTDAARAALLLTPMTPAEAEQLGVAEAERWRHVRLDDAKANMAPRASRAAWFRLDTINLGNATALYPHGDNVAAIAAWKAESVWSRLSPEACNGALDQIARGPEPGLLYAAHRRGRGAERWAGRVLMEDFSLSEGQAAEVIGTWLKTGLLMETAYRDSAQRKTRYGVAVVDARRPSAARPARKGAEP
ncbi:MAG: AAA family ATPase [Acidisphaera sp.]|nr:AAA family ATPase [Acidisphaera sp.]